MSLSNPDLKYLVGLTHFSKFGPVRIKKIQKYFSGLSRVFKAGTHEIMQAGIEEKIAAEFVSFRKSIDPDRIIEKLAEEKISVAVTGGENYPKLLGKIYDPPPVIYYKGKLDPQDEFSIAVVGTRKMTPYGQRATGQLSEDLVRNKLTIVSGLALGIDTSAHTAALEAGGRTIAVLGSGLDRNNIYPASNRRLAEKIVANGSCLISEFPIGTLPLRHHFPQRNRVIAGLSLGTLVIEAGEKSGALITAYHALEQNREVFALPGSIYSDKSQGPHLLIKQGACLVTSAADIIEALDLIHVTDYIDNKEIIPETKEEEILFPYLSHEPIHIDELVRQTGLDTSKINSTLTIMEMKGMARNLGGMQYVLAR